MNRIALLLSAAPLALVAAPAVAQTAAPQADPSSQQTSTTQTGKNKASAKKSAQNANANDSAASTIVVTGIRKSLQTAESVKKNSDAILDSIVAEDIGKLPDDTAAESAARVPGVQVVRYNDEVSGVLIRGLPDVATSYNGREIFSAELRRVELQDFPSQAVAQMDIYKSGTADIIEPGLAGLVNVRTRRPFDFKGAVIAGGIHGTYNDQSRKFDPAGNILLSDRWHTGIGDIGLLVNLTYVQSQYANGVRYNDGWIRDSSLTNVATPNVGVFSMPNKVGLYNESGRRFRPSGNFSAQWAPNDKFNVYAEGIYQGYRGHGTTDNFFFPLIDWTADNQRPTLSNVVLVDGTNQAASLTHTGGLAPQGSRQDTHDGRNTYQLAVGANWHNDRLTLSTDAAYTWSEYFRNAWSVDFATQNVGDIDVAFNQDGGAAFSLPGWDARDPNNYVFRGYWNEAYHMKSSGWQWRADASYDTDLGFLPKIQAGVRVTTRTAEEVEHGTRYGWVLPLGIPESDLPVGPLQMTLDPFRGSAQGLTSFLSIPGDALYNNREAIRQFTYNALQQMVAMNPADQGSLAALNAFSTAEVQPDPMQKWKALEDTYAAYIQGKYGFSLGSIGVDGVVGVRVVKTKGSNSGVSSVCLLNTTATACTATYTPRTGRQDYTDVLPNASMRVKFTPQLQLRLGYTKTRTKPSFWDLNPALTINPVCINCTTTPGTPVYYASGGNPDLKPFISNNYDASLEYYFSKTGYVSAGIFRRDLKGFLTNVTVYPNDPTYGLLQLSEPINAGDGKIDGFELNAQTFLNFLPSPWNGFGASANVTYLKGKTRYPNGYNPNTNTFDGPGVYQAITGLSKWTYNLAGFYEKGGITARVSYNWRSTWVNWYSTDQNGNYVDNRTRPVGRLDASISYDMNKHLTLTADASNILARPFEDYTRYAPPLYFPQDVRDEGRYFGLGVRFRFGQ
jgi:TonB-dependent receptor